MYVEKSKGMALGPLEYLVVGLEGDEFNNEVLPELYAAWEQGIIRVVDLYILRKNASGVLTAQPWGELGSQEAGPMAGMAGDLLGLLTPEDIEQAGRVVPADSSAALLLFEHTWAIGLKEAIKRANGKALAGGLVAPDVLVEVEEELEAS